jgi:hypothetical protein
MADRPRAHAHGAVLVHNDYRDVVLRYAYTALV